MHFDILRIVKKIQNNVTCPICGRHFKFNEVKIKYILDDIVVFSLNCKNNHNPIQTVHVVIFEKNNYPIKDKFRKSIISNVDASQINKQIKEFDGDFIKLWKK